MSSLRLALKQSLEHAGPSVREVQSKGKRRGRPKKNEKEQHKKRKKRKLTDSEKKLLRKDDDDDGDDDVPKNKHVRTPPSINRTQKNDVSDNGSDSDDDSHESSSGSSSSGSDDESENSGSGSDSGDDNSAGSSSDEDGDSPNATSNRKTLVKHDDNSDDDKSQDAQMMEGVFETEASSGDDDDKIYRKLQPSNTVEGGTTISGNQSESSPSLQDARSRKIDRDMSISHHSQASNSQASSSQVKKDKTSLASASKSQESKKSIKRKKKNVPPPRQEVLAWVMGMSQGKQRKNIKPGLRVKVRFTKPKIRWYGGVVTKVASSNPGGHRIKIKYDDGNKEVADFPDKEIVVDAEGNGVHQADADAFLPRDLPVLLSVPVEKKKKKKIKMSSKYDDESQTGESTSSNSESNQMPQRSNEKQEKKSSVEETKYRNEGSPFDKSLKTSSEKKESPIKNKIQPIPKSFEEDSLPRVDKSPAKKKAVDHKIDADAETDEDTSMPDSSRGLENDKKYSDTPVTKTIVLNKQSVESNTSLSRNSEFTNDNIENEGEDEDMKSVEVSSQKDTVMEDNDDDTSRPGSSAQDDVSDKESEHEYERSTKKVKSDKKIKKKLADIESEDGYDDDTGAEEPIDRRRKENKIAADGFKKKKRRKDKEDGRKRKKEVKEEEVTDSENWVQCERCMKWRCLHTLTNEEVEKLPDKWYCEMNTDVMRNFCAAPEQTAAEVARERKKKARGLKRTKSLSPTNDQSPSFEDVIEKQSRNSDSGDESQMVDDGSFITSQSRRGRRGGRQPTEEKVKRGRGRASKHKEDDKQQEWVQCENCEKWRRLPLAISAKDLPDKWYCSMNTWDPRSASCAVQEDYKKEEKPKENILSGAGGNGVSSGGSRLSYRNLIRQPTRTISERMRAADSIFSNHASVPYEEQSGFPVCLYATSSLFQQRMRFGAENNDPEPTTSLIDVMNKTQLWKNLYRADVTNDDTSSPWNISGKNLLADIKIMVHQVMPFGKSMAANEIMLECQCRDLGVKFREVSALVTFDLVSSAIYELVNEGKLEKVTGIPEKVLSFGEPDITTSDSVTLYRKVGAEPMEELLLPKASPTEISPSNSIVEEKSSNNTFNSTRLMKFSKPWKKQQIKFD